MMPFPFFFQDSAISYSLPDLVSDYKRDLRDIREKKENKKNKK